MKKYFKYSLIILSALILAIIQISFLNNFSLFYVYLLVLIILTFFNINLAINFAFWLGLFIDLLNFKNFGWFLVGLIIMSFFVYYLYINYLTHKNLITYFILCLTGFLFFNVYLLITDLLFKIFNYNLGYLKEFNFFYFFKQLIYYLIIFLIFYLVFYLINKRFKIKW